MVHWWFLGSEFVSIDEHCLNFPKLEIKLTYPYSPEFLIPRIFNNVAEINLYQRECIFGLLCPGDCPEVIL